MRCGYSASRIALQPFLVGLLFLLVDAKGTFYGSPFRYNLYKSGVSPQYTPGKPMSRHKNYCAYVVQKNITCTMQDGTATYVKAEYNKCSWGQKCPPVMYRTFYKPKYKIGYKTVTELEWRCCPGYSGDGCFEGPTSLPDIMMPPFKGPMHHPGFKGYPRGHPKMHPYRKPFPGSYLEPGKTFPVGPPEHHSIPTGNLPVDNYAHKFGVTGERLDRMEEDMRQLSQNLEKVNGLVTGLEDRLRLSLREDTSKMLGTLLSSSPRASDSVVGFGVIPDGTPDGLEGGEGFPGFGELAGRVMEVRDELRAKSNMLDEIQGMVLGHDGQLKHLMDSASGRPIPEGSRKLLEELVDAKLASARAEILDGFEQRLTGAETRCDERIGKVQILCQEEQLSGQEQIRQSLDGHETGLRKELGDLQAQILGLTVSESCCIQVASLAGRVLLLEEAVKGLTESQRLLQTSFSEQSAQMETALEEVEVRINTSLENRVPVGMDGFTWDGFRTELDGKLKALEERVLVTVEEMNNATAPSVLEGQVVPALGVEIDGVRQRLESDLDGVQKQLTDLELLCTSSCSAPDGEVGILHAGIEECKDAAKAGTARLDAQADRLDRLNATIIELLTRREEEDDTALQGEITLLKINVNSVNRTLKGLRDSVSVYARQVTHANSTWQEQEGRLASRLEDVARQVGRQTVQLGAGERRLLQLKGELQGLRRRLAGELQECAQRQAQGVGQCYSLEGLAQDMERIRGELEGHSDSFLAQVNGTLSTHSQQLAELKENLKDCVEQAGTRGDQ